ncbi:hypothetical protein FDECE_2734 [Fusarium decemcellulare]|nr:hypothetical protein FDECE_2734 [Fusarium decemcellulare]
MWRPTHSFMPSGITFLVLSLAAQLTSAAAIPDGPAGVDQYHIYGRAANTTETTSTEVIPVETTTSNDVLSTSDWIPSVDPDSTTVAIDTPTSSVGDTTTSDTIISTDTTSTEVAPETTTSSDVLSSTETSTVPTDTTTTTIDDATTSDTTISTDTTVTTDTTASTSEADTAAPVTGTSTTETSADVTTGTTTTEAIQETTTEASETTEAPVTAPPTETSAAVAQATATASKYNDEVALIIPIINSWTEDPENLKDETLDKVNNLINGVKDAIKDLGGSESSGCNSKKRGLLDFVSGVINTLSCVVSNLEDVTGKITGGIVDGVAPIVTNLSNNNKELEEQSEEEEEKESKTEEEESKTESEEASTTEQTTETTTTAESTTSETETTTTTSGECKMRSTTKIPGASNTNPTTTIPFPVYTGVTTDSDTATSTDASSTSGETSETSTTTIGTETTSDVSTSTEETSEVSTTTTEETSEVSSTTETSEVSTTTEGTETSAPTTTPSTLVTTTRPSSEESSSTITTDSTITSAPVTTTSDQTSAEETRTYFPCGVYGGPRVASAYCQCTTTVSGKQYFATTTLVDGQCTAYTEFPSSINPATEAPAPTDAPINEPFTETVDGTVLAYSSYKLGYFQVWSDVQVTRTEGLGDPSTLSTPVPTQTAVDNDGSGQCGTSDGLSKSGLGEACDRAIGEFEDDTIYTGYTTRYSRSKKGILMVASMGQAACIAKFSCDDYGIGMSGRLIKEAREKAKSDDNIWMCGHIELSNSCKVVMDYCTNCNNEG